MNLYRVSFSNASGETTKWVGTQADAARARADFITAFDIERKAISIEEVNVPTKKDELLAWLNSHAI